MSPYMSTIKRKKIKCNLLMWRLRCRSPREQVVSICVQFLYQFRIILFPISMYFWSKKKNTHFQQLVLSGFRCIFVQLDLIEQMHKEGIILLSRVAMFQNKTHKRPETIPPPPFGDKVFFFFSAIAWDTRSPRCSRISDLQTRSIIRFPSQA